MLVIGILLEHSWRVKFKEDLTLIIIQQSGHASTTHVYTSNFQTIKWMYEKSYAS